MMLYGRHERQPADRVLDRYLQAVAPFAPSAGGSRPRLFASTETAIPAVPAEPFIAIAPGAHWPTKRWPVEHFQALVAALSKRGLSIVLVGNADDRQACDAIASAATGIVNRAGMLDLAQLKAVVARSRMAITNDTGVMHIAEALGKPVAALFGPTVPQFGFAPWRPESVLIEQDLDCRPCSLHGSKTCPRGHFQCMRGIVPQVVLEAVNALLAP
jgi:heptosyltransferase-2